MTDETNDKPRRGWQPGQSGNPAGRKPDSGLTQLRQEIAKHAPDIIAKLVEKAKAGDVKAARVLLERAVPALKAEATAVLLPELAAATGLVAQGEAIVKAVATGELAPDTGAQLIAALNQQSRLLEVEELERRIAALEDPNGLV